MLSFFLYGMFSGRSLWVNLVFMMGIIVANVPEGLLPTFTLALAMGSLRMARKNVLVTSLNAVEALGAVEVICTDKTGTLTLNQLAVTHLVRHRVNARDQRCQKNAVSCWRWRSVPRKFTRRNRASAAIPSMLPLPKACTRQAQTRADTCIVSSTTLLLMSRRNALPASAASPGRLCSSSRGPGRSIRPMLVAAVSPDGKVIPIDQEELDQAEATMAELAARGLRVIAVAYRQLAAGDATSRPDQASLEKELVLAGFIGIEDPLRPEVPAALASCHAAGIEVILITGDHPDTAMNIAVRSGIVSRRGIGASVS